MSNNSFIAGWKATFPREIHYMSHSTGRQSDSCKCPDNQLSWVAAILDLYFISWNRAGMLTGVVEGADPLHENKNQCEYTLFWIIVLSWMQRKDQKQCLTGETPFFWTKYGTGEIIGKDLSTKLKWMVIVLLSSGCSWRWRAVFPRVVFPHGSLPVILCKTNYCAKQKNHQCKC